MSKFLTSARLFVVLAGMACVATCVQASDAPVPTPAPAEAGTLTPAAPLPPAPPPARAGAPGGDAMSGMRVGNPYYWSAPHAEMPPAAFPLNGPGAGYGPWDAGIGSGSGSGCGCNRGANSLDNGGYAPHPDYFAAPNPAPISAVASHGTPFYRGGGVNPAEAADPYYHHFGPGYYRHSNAGYYRFPWYSYRAPWYYPGHPSFNRDTNLPW